MAFVAGDETISTFRFHPNYRVDLILNRNLLTRVQGVYYFRPGVEYDFMRSTNGQRFGGGFSAIWTRASQFIQTPGHKRDLGVELDFSLYFQSKDGALNDDPDKMGGFFTMLQYGVLFPLGGLDYQAGEQERIQAELWPLGRGRDLERADPPLVSGRDVLARGSGLLATLRSPPCNPATTMPRRLGSWPPVPAAFRRSVALRVYTSRLLGADPALVLHGGGNTSVKATASELTGESVEVLYVKGSGWDLAQHRAARVSRPAGSRRCAALAELEALSDEDMVKLLRSQMLDPASPTPSVEALLHAWLPARFVDHTHADAVLAVVDQPDSAERARADLARGAGVRALRDAGIRAGEEDRRARRRARAMRSVMVLDKHGIFTWGETAKESYERMIEAVTAAERALGGRATSSRRARALPRPDSIAGRGDGASGRSRRSCAARSRALRGGQPMIIELARRSRDPRAARARRRRYESRGSAPSRPTT